MTPRYSISILGFNRLDLTKRCVESVLQNSCNYELLLWDNGSTDGTFEYFCKLEKLYAQVRVQSSTTNQGFIEPNRQQLARARGQYFVLLNNDTEVPPGWLQKLEHPFLIHKDAALVGVEGTCCHLEVTQGPLCLIGKPGIFEYVEGSCLMGRADLLKRHGLFADYLEFAYCEDADLSLRMRYLGYSIHQVPLNIKHVRSATSKSVSGIREVMAKNMLTMTEKWRHYLRMRVVDHPILIRRKHAIGDVLLTTPIIRALHEAKPKCPILVETDFPEVFDRNPCVTQAARKIIVPPTAEVIELNYENETEANYVEAYARCAGLGAVVRPKILELYPGYGDVSEAGRLLSKSGRWAAIHAGATTWPGRNWPIESMRQIADWLLKRGWNIALLNLHKDPAYGIPCTVDLRGQLNVLQQAAVQRYCSLFVGQDSLPLHIAQAMGTPVVGIFGATLPQYVMTDGSPWKAVCADPSIKCAGERHRVAGAVYVPCDGKCIRSIRTEDIKKAIEELV